MRPAFPTREFRSLLRSSRWRESMPQQAQTRPQRLSMLQRPRPTRFVQCCASVLPGFSLHPSEEPVRRRRHARASLHRRKARRRISARELDLLVTRSPGHNEERARPPRPDRAADPRRTPRKVEQHRVAASRADSRTKGLPQ